MDKDLGFGLMRLPHRGPSIDIERTSEMIDRFMEAGYTYFDTAFVYVGSEKAARKALIERHPRESYTLATKLYAAVVPTEALAKKELDTSLKRTGTGYIDYYLLHSLTQNNYAKFDKFHLWDFVREEKEKGRIRHIGFSFHGGPELLDKLLTDHPETEFVQLQLNYADWEDPRVQARANYEVARRHGMPIVVMEPVKGGKLANPPEEVKRMFDAVRPGASYASWAMRFVAQLEGVRTVLSGMSNMEQLQDNLDTMMDFRPLDEEETEAVRRAQKVFNESKEIPCTSCHYCTGGCPEQIPIPEIFDIMNRRTTTGQAEKAEEDYGALTDQSRKASACIACGQCETVCPQQIKVMDELKLCAAALEE